MDIYDFQDKYTTEFADQNETKIMFYPLSTDWKEGTMITTYKNQKPIGGTYSIRQDGNTLYIGWFGKEYLFSPTEKGFNLIIGDTITYEFTLVNH